MRFYPETETHYCLKHLNESGIDINDTDAMAFYEHTDSIIYVGKVIFRKTRQISIDILSAKYIC